MKQIKLQFVTGEGYQSRIIRWFTWSDYSHVDVVLEDGRLLGARMDTGVQIRPENYGVFTNKLDVTVEVSDSEYQAAMDWVHAQVGKPYDKTGILNFALHSRDWQEPDSWFCSELVAGMFEAIGKRLLRASDVKRITPRDLTLSPYLVTA